MRSRRVVKQERSTDAMSQCHAWQTFLSDVIAHIGVHNPSRPSANELKSTQRNEKKFIKEKSRNEVFVLETLNHSVNICHLRQKNFKVWQKLLCIPEYSKTGIFDRLIGYWLSDWLIDWTSTIVIINPIGLQDSQMLQRLLYKPLLNIHLIKENF